MEGDTKKFIKIKAMIKTRTNICQNTTNSKRKCWAGSDLWPVQADDAVDVARAVVEVGHGDGVFAGGNPVLLGVRVDLEDVRSGAEDGLLSAGNTHTQLQCMMGKHSTHNQLIWADPRQSTLRLDSCWIMKDFLGGITI